MELTSSQRACGAGPLNDPFGGLFAAGAPAIAPGSLLDIEAARDLFEAVAQRQAEDIYTYQQVFAGASGPRVVHAGRSCVMLSAYDYLGLIGHAALNAASIVAIRRYGTATGGVRLLTGSAEVHRQLEAALAESFGTESALTFSSGYVANIGVIAALFGPRDLVIGDAYVHRSIIDGCRMAAVPLRRFRHNDPEALDRLLRATSGIKRRLVVVEGVYSMDGDLCPLPEILAVARRHGAWLMIDEAHSLGVVGAMGRGAVAHFGVDPAQIDVITGSLNKAIPAGGGFVAGRRTLTAYLQHSTGPFVFSGAVPPACAAAATAALNVMRSDAERHARLRRNAERLRTGLAALGFDVGRSACALIPVITASDEGAFRLARRLLELGVIAAPVVAPAVPPGAARLRLCATAAHDESDLDAALAAFAVVSKESAWRAAVPMRLRLARRTETLTYESISQIAPPLWDSLVPAGDLLATHRFVHACESAAMDGARLRHVLVYESGRLAGAASLFRLEVPLDILSAGMTRLAISWLRRLQPGALRVSIVFCGLPVSFGSSCLRLAPDADRPATVARVLAAMEAFAAETDSDVLCVKEFDARAQAELGAALQAAGFASAPSLPGCRMALPWQSMPQYRDSLRAGYRRQLDLDRRAAVAAGLRRSLSDGLAPGVDEAHRLYAQVIRRAQFKLEELPHAFFQALSNKCGPDLRSVVIEHDGCTVANAILLGRAPTCYFLLAGLDYARLGRGHVYQNLVAAVLEAAIAGRASTLELGQTSYAMKTRLGAVATPRFVWLKHRRPLHHLLLALASRRLFSATRVPARRVFRADIWRACHEEEAPAPATSIRS